MLAALVVAAAAAVAGVSPAAATDDTYFAQQWNLTQIGAPAAWATSTGADVLIGVVDTGIEASHPEFEGKIEAQADCVGAPCREGSARDVDGHGTAVAGIAAAKADNGVGIAGVAPDARLLVAKALADDGTGRTVDINNAIQWVVDRGARIVNLSLGDADQVYVSRVGTSLASGIQYAWSRGAIPVLASGNYQEGFEDGVSFNYGNLDAVVVGATTAKGSVAEYSTALGNAKWSLLAPGGSGDGPGADVMSPALRGRYEWLAGTSMAAPHVSGVLALLLAQGLSPSAAVQHLLASRGEGRVRADAAVAAAAAKVQAQVAGVPIGGVPLPTRSEPLNFSLVTLAIVLVVAAGVGSVWVARTGANQPV